MIWYQDYEARHIINDLYYVDRGQWNDPIYVVALKETNVPVFGKHIDGIEINYWDIRDAFDENDVPSSEDTYEAVLDFLDARGWQ